MAILSIIVNRWRAVRVWVNASMGNNISKSNTELKSLLSVNVENTLSTVKFGGKKSKI